MAGRPHLNVELAPSIVNCTEAKSTAQREQSGIRSQGNDDPGAVQNNGRQVPARLQVEALTGWVGPRSSGGSAHNASRASACGR